MDHSGRVLWHGSDASSRIPVLVMVSHLAAGLSHALVFGEVYSVVQRTVMMDLDERGKRSVKCRALAGRSNPAPTTSATAGCENRCVGGSLPLSSVTTFSLSMVMRRWCRYYTCFFCSLTIYNNGRNLIKQIPLCISHTRPLACRHPECTNVHVQ